MKRFVILVLLFIVLILSSCSKLFKNPFSNDGDDGARPSAVPDRVIEPTARYALSIGGVAPGREELVIYDEYGNVRNFSGKVLDCVSEEPILILHPRPGFPSLTDGSGAQMVAVEPGVTGVTCTEDGEELGIVYEITIPPQNLVQILVAEAGEQLADEANQDEDGNVELSSVSKTGDVLGMVIRNRIERINAADDPFLFEANLEDYDADPPASYYDEVILAPDQFSPTDPRDPSHGIFDLAQDRSFLSEEWKVAYDQAVLTAAAVFNGDTRDSTNGAFAFMSPTEDEWSLITQTWTSNSMEIPLGIRFSDATFPTLAPIQILIHPDIWKYDDGRPSFVLVRQRTLNDPAVTNVP